MYEQRSDPLLPRRDFAKRWLRHGGVAALFLIAWLALGVAGYHWLAHQDWINAILNASMILSGMGPVEDLDGNTAKLFASFYALVSGVVFLGASGVVIAPVLHRVLHKFHLDEKDDPGEGRKR